MLDKKEKKSFDLNLSISVFVGAFVITLYDWLSAWFRLWYTKTEPNQEFWNETLPKEYAGLIIGLIGLSYALISTVLSRRKTITTNYIPTKKKRSIWDKFWNGDE